MKEKYGDPLGVMAEIMTNENLSDEIRLEAAAELASYLHEPISAIDDEENE